MSISSIVELLLKIIKSENIKWENEQNFSIEDCREAIKLLKPMLVARPSVLPELHIRTLDDDDVPNTEDKLVLQINKYEDRKAIVYALANSGYPVIIKSDGGVHNVIIDVPKDTLHLK